MSANGSNNKTVAGILAVDEEKAEALKRRFSLPAAHVEVSAAPRPDMV